ncbi:MAG: adenylosuccinate synthase [bacterium]|nr:adenylosuccinate synthase [bacterium]
MKILPVNSYSNRKSQNFGNAKKQSESGSSNKVAVIGAQWGDEGKAKVTNLLAQRADLVIRFSGGANAGHTVVADGNTYKFHLIPSGILYPNTTCFIGAGTVLHPESFENEVKELKEQGVKFDNLKISPLATLTMPYNVEVDAWIEANSAKSKFGSTKKGIAPTYSDKVAKTAFKVQDLYSPDAIDARLDMILPLKNKELQNVYGLQPYTKEQMLSLFKDYAELFKPYVCFDWQDMLHEFKDKSTLFEGAQAVMLDVDYGTYPYVTSSNPIAGGAAVGSGYGPTSIKKVIGVAKAYVTRVGEGDFVTEQKNEIGKKLQDIGHEFGVTTGRPRRCGWFDGVQARYAALVGGITDMALTKIDVYDNFDEIKVCTAYKDIRDGKIYKSYPTDIYMHKYLEPVYETMPGWKTPLSGIKTYEKLPEKAKEYIAKIEKLVGIPVSIISVGPDREQTIFVDKHLPGKTNLRTIRNRVRL